MMRRQKKITATTLSSLLRFEVGAMNSTRKDLSRNGAPDYAVRRAQAMYEGSFGVAELLSMHLYPQDEERRRQFLLDCGADEKDL